MGFPSYFDKALQSAAALIRGQNVEGLRAALTPSVAICIDESAANEEGAVAQELAADLLGRLWPTISVKALDNRPATRAACQSVERSILRANPAADIISDLNDQVVAAIVFGATALTGPLNCAIYAGSNGWIARVGSRPVGSGSSANPFGAAAAACIAVANVFRVVFEEPLGAPGLDDDLSLNMASFSIGDAIQPPLADVDIGETILVGCGAIGHGLLWAIERMPGLVGTLRLVDDEDYDPTNAQRYVGIEHSCSGSKVVACANRFDERQGLAVVPAAMSWDAFLSMRANWRMDRVLVAVDSAEDRRLIQSSLPKQILNAWTQRENVGVSRHGFLEGPCLACLYLPKDTEQHMDVVVANALRFPNDRASLQRLRELIDTNRPMDAALISSIEHQVNLAAGSFSEFVGQPLMSLYQRAACAGAVIALGGQLGEVAREAEVPMSFQSAMAGVMLATELTLASSGLPRKKLTARTEINLLRRIRGTLNTPAGKSLPPRCICQDSDYIQAYQHKYLPGV